MGGEERDMASGEDWTAKKSAFKRESGWTLPDKNETASWNWKLSTAGRWISTHKNVAPSRSPASVLQGPHAAALPSFYRPTTLGLFFLLLFSGVCLNNRVDNVVLKWWEKLILAWLRCCGWNKDITEALENFRHIFFFTSLFSLYTCEL